MNQQTIKTIALNKRENKLTAPMKEVLKSIARKGSVSKKDLATIKDVVGSLWGTKDFTHLDAEIENEELKISGHLVCPPPVDNEDDFRFDSYFVRGEFKIVVKG